MGTSRINEAREESRGNPVVGERWLLASFKKISSKYRLPVINGDTEF